MNSVDLSIGARVRDLRNDRGVSLLEMARKLMIEPKLLQAWESGEVRMRPADLFNVTACLNVPLSALFEWVDDTPTIANSRLH